MVQKLKIAIKDQLKPKPRRSGFCAGTPHWASLIAHWSGSVSVLSAPTSTLKTTTPPSRGSRLRVVVRTEAASSPPGASRLVLARYSRAASGSLCAPHLPADGSQQNSPWN